MSGESWFEDPAVRRHFGMAGLDWKVFLTYESEDTEDVPEDTATETATATTPKNLSGGRARLGEDPNLRGVGAAQHNCPTGSGIP